MQKRYAVEAFIILLLIGYFLIILSTPRPLAAQAGADSAGQAQSPKSVKPSGQVTASSPSPAAPESCVSANCHAALGKDKVVHKPVKEGMCTTCHQAAGDPQKKAKHPGNLIITLVRQGADLCFRCHRDKEEGLKSKKVAHRPVKKSCVQCHNPHGSAIKAMLTAPVPELCSTCHPIEATLRQRALTKHGPMQDQKSCLNCHDSHFSDQHRLLLTEERALCLACHNKVMAATTGTMKDLKGFLDASKGGQGPLKGKPCGSCHSPHGSDYWRLLMNYYVTSLYVPYSDGQYSFCFYCHNKEAFKVSKTDKKTAKLTNFRDGDKNLHFVHVNRISKGRTCRACHEACAECQSSGLQKHVKESIQYGGWNMPMNFAPNANGGSCAPGCHGEKMYSR